MSPQKRVERFFITAKAPLPLGRLLSQHLAECYNAETIIWSGGAWKDNKRVFDPKLIIKVGETVKVNTNPFQGRTYSLSEEHIIFENQDILVVYKPCDINVNFVPASVQYNLMYAVNIYLAAQGVAFEATPVTRLDRSVEGLVIFPKNKISERKLFQQVRDRCIQKWYIGALAPNEGPKYTRIRDRITNSGRLTFADSAGKTAETLFVKTQRLENADLYSIFIFTGRRHQIRFHASRYITPIVGDAAYGSRFKMGPDEIALMCRGYNIPYQKQLLKIRIPQPFIDQFKTKAAQAAAGITARYEGDSPPQGK